MSEPTGPDRPTDAPPDRVTLFSMGNPHWWVAAGPDANPEFRGPPLGEYVRRTDGTMLISDAYNAGFADGSAVRAPALAGTPPSPNVDQILALARKHLAAEDWDHGMSRVAGWQAFEEALRAALTVAAPAAPAPEPPVGPPLLADPPLGA